MKAVVEFHILDDEIFIPSANSDASPLAFG